MARPKPDYYEDIVQALKIQSLLKKFKYLTDTAIAESYGIEKQNVNLIKKMEFGANPYPRLDEYPNKPKNKKLIHIIELLLEIADLD